VVAKIAFDMAGATGGTPGFPIPVGGSLELFATVGDGFRNQCVGNARADYRRLMSCAQ